MNPGGRYRVAEGQIEVDSVELVPFSAVDDADLRRSGEADLRPSACEPLTRVLSVMTRSFTGSSSTPSSKAMPCGRRLSRC